MQAVINGTVLAEAADADMVSIEGNWYFPPEAVASQVLSKSDTPYTCPWKGVAQYFDVRSPEGSHPDAAWAYPEPLGSAIGRVGQDFSRYVAFDKTMVDVG